MKSWPSRLGLSFIVTLGFAISRLNAQAPLVPPSQPFDARPNPPLAAVLARPQEQLPSKHPRLNSHGYCCDSDLNWYGCGGVRSLAQFYFGSCRTFFGEPCFPKKSGE
jgi:hypothetical protein